MKLLKKVTHVLLSTYILLGCAGNDPNKESEYHKSEDPKVNDVKLDRLTGTNVSAELKKKNELKALDRIVGRWINNGKTIATENEPAMDITTSDVYEWVPGKQFVIHYAYGKAGSETGGAVEIIGYDGKSKKYKLYSFDSYGMISEEESTIQDSVWLSQGKRTRCTLEFKNDNNVAYGHHERLDDDGKTWKPSMEIVLTKVN